MRIAKAIAHAGLCSRRDAEKWIEQGRVAINGTVLATPAHVVKPSDKVTVDGKKLPETEAPEGVWCPDSDFRFRTRAISSAASRPGRCG